MRAVPSACARKRWAVIAAALAFFVLGVSGDAEAGRRSSRRGPPPDQPVPGEPQNPFDKGKKKKKGSEGPTEPRPIDKDAGKTVTTRGAYLDQLLADASEEECGESRDAADRACLDAAFAAIPASANAELRRILDDARKLLTARNWESAQAQAEEASALDSKLLAPRLVAAQAIAAQGRQRDAIKGPLDAAVSSNRDDPIALHARALAAWRLGWFDDARKALVHAREGRQADPSLALTLGAVEMERGDAKAACPLLFEAVDAYPEDLFALRSLACSLYRCRDWIGAAATLERVVWVVEGPPMPPGQAAVAGRDTASGEHLALAILLADRLDRPADAKLHARRFLQQGGIDLALDAWIRALAGP